MINTSLLKQEKGGTVVIFLFIMSMLAALAVGALQVTSLNLESANALSKGKQAYYSSEVGLDQAVNAIVNSFENLVTYTSSAQNGGDGQGFITLNNYQGHNVKYSITPAQPAPNRFLYQTSTGQDILNHWAYTYDIVAISTSLTDNSTETLRERIRILETPLVQWFIFYGGQGGAADLEIHSGSNWTGWGRIHTNGNFYIGSTQGAFHRFQNFDPNNGNPIQTPHAITVSGNIIPGTKANNFLVKTGGPPGFATQQFGFTVNRDAEVKTTNTNTVWQDQQTIFQNITAGNQVAEEARFNNFVLAQEQLRNTPGPVIVQRNGFYETRSVNPQQPGVDGIRILGQGGFVPGGFQVTVSRPAPNTDVTALIAAGQTSAGVPYAGPMPIIRERLNDFGDCRENRQVSTTDINMNALTLWYQQYLADPVNGGGALGGSGFIVYASRSPNAAFTNLANPMQAIRLQGGLGGGAPVAQLQGNATIATDNPLYIQGDFNTINRKGVAIIADAINVLSRTWTTKNCNVAYPNTNATTSVNAAFITGNSVTANTFAGGAINYPRFHERWVIGTGTAFNYRGAFINLWTSTQANGAWCLGGNCYSAPIRNWGWETNFQDPNFWPPFLPSVYSVERVGFLE